MANEKYAILGDIHGNWEALTAVLEDAKSQNITHFMCVGDTVGYNANPAECLHKIRELEAVCVRGNHDHYCSHDECIRDFHPLAANVVDWTRSQLTEDDVQFLRQQKLVRVVNGFTLVHSTLDMPEKWGYVFEELEAESNFSYQSTSVCFYGHTHHPVVFEKSGQVRRLNGSAPVVITLGKKYFVNVGSVGQPRDGDNRAAYAIYDTMARKVEIRRVAYDIATTQRKIIDAGLPERLALRLEAGV
jgi:diadenosine tetraphosphatase ApaH/serine/threonine PP2A family protein phosphatase